MSAQPDPRPPRRVKDRDVYTRFHAIDWDCLSCGGRPVEAAHLLRGKDREDNLNGLVPLCHGCHECFDKGLSYRGAFGHKFTPDVVKAKVARYIRSEAGDDARAYLIEKRGQFGAEVYVQSLEVGA